MPTQPPGPFYFCEIETGDGERTRLWGAPIHFVSISGVGLPPVRRIVEKLPTIEGAVDFGFRYEPRRMELQLYIEGEDLYHADGIRDRLAETFLPTSQPIRLFLRRDDWQIFWIECYVDGEIDWSTESRIGPAQRITVPLVAPDPGWNALTPVTVIKSLIDGVTTITLPLNDQTYTTWPKIELVGPYDSGLIIGSELTADTIVVNPGNPSSSLGFVNLSPGVKRLTGPPFWSSPAILTPASLPAFQSLRIPPVEEVRQILGNPSANSYEMYVTASGTSGTSRVLLSYFNKYVSL